MAVTTYTSTLQTATPKAPHIGDCSVAVNFIWPATSTVGDVLFLAKIPQGARILDLVEDHSTGATSQGVKFGFDRGIAAGGAGNLSILIAAGAQATKNRLSVLGLPPIISLSDADPIRYAWFACKVASGTTTTSLVVNAVLTYTMDGNT